MERIADILHDNRVHLSCEVFPPKRFDGIAQAAQVATEIAALRPSFMSVTYGAAGSTPGHTLAIAQAVAEAGVTPLCHLTCVQSTRAHVTRVLADMKAAGMHNVLALRGDLPREGQVEKDFTYAAELVSYIHTQGDFCVGAACYPEGHPECGSRRRDMENLKRKVDAGVDFLTTQMFFDNSILYNFLYRALRVGIDVPVCAGIMPICDTRQVDRVVKLSGSIMPPRFAAIADRFADDPAAMTQAGIAYATEQIIDLVANGITNIHLYTMNKPWIAQAIVQNLSSIIHRG
ncbi:MAG: methylenetetrahydrofolate reductase [Aristaeellaceae bacterium]